MKRKGWICLIICLGILCCLSACKKNKEPMFHDLTVELGTESIGIDDFLNENANPDKAGFDTDPSTISLETVGKTRIRLSYGKKIETVTLTVVDTTAPKVKFAKSITRDVDYKPDPNDFIESVEDFSETTASFVSKINPTGEYEDFEVEIVVTDASGNETKGKSVLKYIWIKDEYILELGDKLSVTDLLLSKKANKNLIDQEDIDKINESGVGEYEIKSTFQGKTATCKVIVKDTVAPTLKVHDVYLYEWETCTQEDFIDVDWDVSEVTEVTMTGDIKFGTIGTYPVKFVSKDPSGNETKASVNLVVKEDDVGPQISGLWDMSVDKYTSPDFMSGVYAYDAKFGECSVTCDSSAFNSDKAGTYYIRYTSQDPMGNTTFVKRTVTVNHDSEDTNELVRQMAAQCGSDLVSIKNFVCNTIAYGPSDGGSDPVWYGFTQKSGDCVVHAYCLLRLLQVKGYSAQIIGFPRSGGVPGHYWCLVMTGSGWMHIDATPGIHQTYDLMNDAQRYATLVNNGVQRDWNRSAYPACGDDPGYGPDDPNNPNNKETESTEETEPSEEDPTEPSGEEPSEPSEEEPTEHSGEEPTEPSSEEENNESEEE